MGKFDDILASLRNPGEDGLPDSVYDDLAAEYNALLSGGAEKEAAHEAALQAKDAEISRLKAVNYDLMISQPGGQQEVDNDTQTETSDEPQGIDDLFEN